MIIGDLAYNGQIICTPIKESIERLISLGFALLNNGDDPSTLFFDVGPKSLHFKLKGPVDLNEFAIANATYHLAPLGDNMFMCECDYHVVKLITSD